MLPDTQKIMGKVINKATVTTSVFTIGIILSFLSHYFPETKITIWILLAISLIYLSLGWYLFSGYNYYQKENASKRIYPVFDWDFINAFDGSLADSRNLPLLKRKPPENLANSPGAWAVVWSTICSVWTNYGAQNAARCASESTKNLICEDLYDPAIENVEKDNIKGFIKNILADHKCSHSNFKKRRGQN